MKNFSNGHLLRNNMKSMQKFFSFIQDASPLKIHDIHIFNTVRFFHLVMALIKPFLKTEIANKVKKKTWQLVNLRVAWAFFLSTSNTNRISSDASSFIIRGHGKDLLWLHSTIKLAFKSWWALWVCGSLAREIEQRVSGNERILCSWREASSVGTRISWD